MPTRALVLSSDEKALDAVSHVLGELEIAFEQFHDLAFAMKRLEAQAFDLVVIDCDQQQEAVRLLDTMRSSNQNRGAMTVAIVDGRAGVPIAFRLGAELVIPKPVSLEQARSTLRTAVAMHRKTHPEAKVLVRPAPVLVQPATPAKPKPTIAFSDAKLSVPKPKPVNLTPSLSGPTEAEPTSKKDGKRGLTLSVPGVASKNNHEPALDLIPVQPAKSAHDNSGHALPAEAFEPGSAKRSINSGLVAALVLAMIGAGGYGAYTMVPRFRATVDENYHLLRSQIPGAQPPVAAVVAKPARPAVKPAPAPAVPADGFVASAESAVLTETAAPAESKPVILATTATTTTTTDEPVAITVPDDVADQHVSSRVDPVYPETLRRKGIRGEVVLKAMVAKDGTVDSLSVVSGNPQLAAAAMDAVKQWKFQTYLHNGTPSSFQTNVTVAFEPAPKSAH